jgi:hypothetical protein
MRWEWKAEAVYVDVLVMMVATAPASMLFLMRPGKREKDRLSLSYLLLPYPRTRYYATVHTRGSAE